MNGLGGLRGRSRGEALEDLWAFLHLQGPGESALKELRGQMTQQELAAEAGVSQALVSDIEGGRKALTRPVAEEIAGVLGVPPGALEVAVRLGRLKQLLEAEPGEAGPLTMQVTETLALVQEYLPDGELKLEMREVLTKALVEAASRDRERMKELQAKESGEKKMATKSKGRKKRPGKTRDAFGRNVALKGVTQDDRPGRDRFGRRIHKPNAPAKDAAPEPRKGLDGRLLRDSRGRVLDKPNDPRRTGRS